MTQPPSNPHKNPAQNHTINPEREWFGNQQVNPAEKTRRVLGVFDSVATKYDIMNDAMSGGLHRVWKNRLIRAIRPHKDARYLDVAGGTGDIAFRIHDAVQGQAPITVCDINESMLTVGRNRAIDSGRLHNLDWVVGNAETLPFPDAHFDVVTIAFGLRNVTHIDQALTEFRRVLRPGGRFFCLEFSQVNDPLLRRLYNTYSDIVIPRLGQMIAGDRESYDYLVESIRKFPKRAILEQRMRSAGFDKAESWTMTAGIVAVHAGYVY